MLLHWRAWGCKWGGSAITPVCRNPCRGAQQTAVSLCRSALPESVAKRLRCNKTGRSEDNAISPSSTSSSSSAGNLSCSSTSTSLSHCRKLESLNKFCLLMIFEKIIMCVFSTSSFSDNFIHFQYNCRLKKWALIYRVTWGRCTHYSKFAVANEPHMHVLDCGRK